MPQVHQLWALPLQITFALAILSRVVGPACMAGVVCILLLIAMQVNMLHL
jgi:hypothetical protein